MKQIPRIVRSDLTKPPRWYVVTRYVEKDGTNATTGEPMRYLVAQDKFNVTDQMERILADTRRQRRT